MATHRGTFHPIQRRGRKWVVVARHSGRVLGTHDTYEDALEQLRAVEVHRHSARRNPPIGDRRDDWYEAGVKLAEFINSEPYSVRRDWRPLDSGDYIPSDDYTYWSEILGTPSAADERAYVEGFNDTFIDEHDDDDDENEDA